MYEIVLFTHSWVRWLLVLIAAALFVRSIFALVQSSAHTRADQWLAKLLFNTLNIQLVIGLLLYAIFSPITRAALSDIGLSMQDSVLRFFMIEHQFAALLAIGIGHVAVAKSKRAEGDRAKHRAMLKWGGFCLFLILLAIPWPFMRYARPLFFW
ncbi:MAG: hypothetical protein ACI906_000797 [Candidatus Latescibacterota bacterium]|jgi:hypothetical protein